MKKEELVLYGDKIYTSYFAVVDTWVPKKLQVSISVTCPPDFEGTQCDWLKPPKELIWAYKNGEVSESLYIDIYTDNVLSELDPEKVYMALKGKVLCCWERAESFCHRGIFLEWARRNIGNDKIGGEISFILKKGIK